MLQKSRSVLDISPRKPDYCTTVAISVVYGRFLHGAALWIPCAGDEFGHEAFHPQTCPSPETSNVILDLGARPVGNPPHKTRWALPGYICAAYPSVACARPFADHVPNGKPWLFHTLEFRLNHLNPNSIIFYCVTIPSLRWSWGFAPWGPNLNLLSCSCHSKGGKCLRGHLSSFCGLL